jgi:predicted CopG family antitoxin
MGSKTISLEDSAYMKLKAAKRPGESFSDVIHRILVDREPSFSDFQGLLDRKATDRLAEAIARMKREDIEAQKRRLSRRDA